MDRVINFHLADKEFLSGYQITFFGGRERNTLYFLVDFLQWYTEFTLLSEIVMAEKWEGKSLNDLVY
jgi:hypothetical protein